jgi:hypothetical protein
MRFEQNTRMKNLSQAGGNPHARQGKGGWQVRKRFNMFFALLVAAVAVGALDGRAMAQATVWRVQSFSLSGPYGTTSHSGNPPLPDRWGPSGWPGTVWIQWDCEVIQSADQFAYVSTAQGPAGAGSLGRLWVRVFQQCTFSVSLQAGSGNSFTTVHSTLRNPSDQAVVMLTAAPGTSPAPVQQPVTLLPGTYELRVDSVVAPGQPRQGTGTVRLDFVSTDGDGDGTPDSQDGCPLDPNKTAPGVCGCGTTDIDSDQDGVLDCLDGCPLDPLKASPGQCGCGVAETDSDGDGSADCVDQCPLDPQKSSPGLCGCGIAESDVDADGRVDCIDNCPTVYNPNQADCNNDGIGNACEIAAGAPDMNGNGVPDTCECIADLFVDGQVNGADLGALLSQWGTANVNTVSDINRDGQVNGADLGFLLANWGPCSN